MLTPTQAWAQFYVRQPEVEKGETEIEEHGAAYAGPGEDEDLKGDTHERLKYRSEGSGNRALVHADAVLNGLSHQGMTPVMLGNAILMNVPCRERRAGTGSDDRPAEPSKSISQFSSSA